MWSKRLLAACLALATAVGGGCKPNSEAPGFHPRTNRVRVGAIELNTVQLGPADRATRLVLHGGPGFDHHYMRPWFDALATPAARVVYVDLRGHGTSDAPPDAEGYTLGATAGDVATLIRRISERAPVDVIAHDFGCAIALELASTHPELVRRLVLISPIRDGAQVRAIGARSREVLGEQGWRAINDLSTPQGTLRDPRQLSALFRALGPMWWATPPSSATVEQLTRGVRYRAQTDEHFLVQLLSWDGRRVAREVRAPALVIAGAQDRSFLPAESQTLADSVPHGRFVSIEGAGHLPFVEKAAVTSGEIERFLR